MRVTTTGGIVLIYPLDRDIFAEYTFKVRVVDTNTLPGYLEKAEGTQADVFLKVMSR